MAKMNYQKYRNGGCLDTIKEHSTIFISKILKEGLKTKKSLLEILSTLNYKDQMTAQELVMNQDRFKSYLG